MSVGANNQIRKSANYQMTISNYAVPILLAIVIHAAPASAQELTFGIGGTDFNNDGDDGAVFSAEYRFRPFSQRPVASFAFGAAADVSENGDVFIGAGLWTRWQWNSGWFVDASIMPGLFDEGSAENDLGSTFNFRSLLGVGYRLDNGNAVSAAVSHISNAGLADENPGVNMLSVRYHISF